MSLDVFPGEALALVGESGSGKSTLAAAVLGLLPAGAIEAAGRVTVAGVEVRPGARGLREIRGRLVGLVGQSPFAAFDPLFPVDAQLHEAWDAHAVAAGRDRASGIAAALREAGLDDLPAGAPPHRLSGGMLQRAAVAAAVLHRPPLVVADEPTSALDPVRARALADTLLQWKGEGTALLVVTHDLALAARVADRVHVLRDGRTVAEGPAAAVLGAPADPYVAALVAAWPSPLGLGGGDGGA